MRDRLRLIGATLGFLALAILLTIYGMWLFYPLEIQLLQLEDAIYLSSQTIQYNFNILMNYLTNPFNWVLSMPDFRSSASGLHHFQVVKWLFHLAQAVFLLTLPSLYFFIKKLVKDKTIFQYRRWFLSWFLLPLGIGLFAVLIGFNNFFVLFHQILFAGDDTWMFDPLTDPVIRILPEVFFLHAFLLFFVLYQGFFGFFLYKTRLKQGKLPFLRKK